MNSTPSTPKTPEATTPQARTPIHGSQSILDGAAAYNQALAAVEKLKLGSPSKEPQKSKACKASLCAAGGGAAQASRSAQAAQASRTDRDGCRYFSKCLLSCESSTTRPQKRRWSEVEQFAQADASSVPSSPST